MRRVVERIEEESGSILVEVMVSAIVITITAIGVFSAFDAATRTTANERHGARAHRLVQADLARMRTMRISDLSPFFEETRELTVGGLDYTVESDATFISQATGTDTCDEDGASADYIRIRSTVRWGQKGDRQVASAESVVTPPNSTAAAESGGLIVEVVNARDEAVTGVPISGDGPTPFSRETGENGCAVFGNLLEGEYKVSVTAPGWVDRNGLAPKEQVTSVVAEGTNTVVFQYDEPGKIEASFVARLASETAEPTPAGAQAIAVFNSGMTEARAFKAVAPAAEPLQTVIPATKLFPFVSPYSVYAGACELNNPDPTGEAPSEALADVEVPPGEAEPVKVTVELPVLRLKVYKGTSGSPGSVATDAKVTLKDTACPSAGLGTRKLTVPATGELFVPLHYSRKKGSGSSAIGGYAFCASGTSTSSKRKTTLTNLNVPTTAGKIEAGAALNVYLRDASTGSDCW
ncbi:MAG: hypothetical protein ABW196_02860 [Solirubrobacterales bacterium]